MSTNHTLPFKNLFVMRFVLDYFTRIEIGDTTDMFYSILIAHDFTLMIQERTYALSPTRLPELGPLLTLFMTQIRSAYYTNKYETLVIEFVNDAKIVVEPYAEYEAWNINTMVANSPEQLEIYATPQEKSSD